MPENSVTLGLSVIKQGKASATGAMPNTLTKLGKVFQNSCKLNQAASDVTEFFEEGVAAPVARFKSKKIPVVTAQIIVESVNQLAQYIGGTVVNGKFGYNGTEVVANRAISLTTLQGLDIEIPNADIDANLNAELSKNGLLLFDLTITPLSVSNPQYKAFNMGPKVAPSVVTDALSFAAAGETKTATVTAVNDISYAFSDNEDWCHVTFNGKVASILCDANTVTSQRVAEVILNADGQDITLTITQAAASE